MRSTKSAILGPIFIFSPDFLYVALKGITNCTFLFLFLSVSCGQNQFSCFFFWNMHCSQKKKSALGILFGRLKWSTCQLFSIKFAKTDCENTWPKTKMVLASPACSKTSCALCSKCEFDNSVGTLWDRPRAVLLFKLLRCTFHSPT